MELYQWSSLPNQKATIKPKKPGEIITVSPDTEEIVEKDKAQKKDNVKTKKPEEIINISPDTEEVVKKAEPMKQEKAGEGSLKKKATTLTSTFCAVAFKFYYLASSFFRQP